MGRETYISKAFLNANLELKAKISKDKNKKKLSVLMHAKCQEMDTEEASTICQPSC